MATKTAWTKNELTALRGARRVYRNVPKTELATRIVKAGKLGRGRPPAELTGLAQFAHIVRGRTVGQIAARL